MSLEMTLEELKRDTQNLGKYYFKDFGALLVGIQASAEIYLHEPSEKRQRSIEADVELVTNLYKTIPFQEITDDQRYAPLIVVNRLIPQVKETFDLFFQEPTEDHYHQLYFGCQLVHSVGRLYRESFHESLEKVRAHPNGKDWTIRLVGVRGKVWDYAV